ncbi:hypothetical protein RNZ50_16220 [Paracoccaceae bacterium Fryx2]|nr:hypothetical protein [Paracoccaceae bacterium Fryx2]
MPARLFPLIPLALAACTSFPALEGTLSPDGVTPALLPMDQLLAQGVAVNVANGAALVARAAALRARAAAMRGPVHDPATRDRLAQAAAG